MYGCSNDLSLLDPKICDLHDTNFETELGIPGYTPKGVFYGTFARYAQGSGSQGQVMCQIEQI